MTISSTSSVFHSKPASSTQSAGAHIAMDDEKIKDKNPLSNANLPGGVFTHPGVNC